MTQTLPRLFVPPPLDGAADIELNAAQAHYLSGVLRQKTGDALLLFDGISGEWRAKLVSVSRRSCAVRLIQKTRDQTPPRGLHYLFAPLKQARLDYLVQKAVEMGVSRLQPVTTARTIVARLNDERVRANVIEAAEQCGILAIPEVMPLMKFGEMLKGWNPEYALIFCDENAPASSPLAALQAVTGTKIAVFIGPEGGFSPEERSALSAKPYVVRISLGPRIMRADTAAVAALALVNAVLEDWR